MWRFKATGISSLTVLEARSLRSEGWQAWLPPQALEEGPSLPLSASALWLLDLWPHLSSLCLHLYNAFPAMCVSVPFSLGLQSPNLIAFITNYNHFIFLPPSLSPPSLPSLQFLPSFFSPVFPSSFPSFFPSFHLRSMFTVSSSAVGSEIPWVAQIGSPSALKTHSLVIINNTTILLWDYWSLSSPLPNCRLCAEGGHVCLAYHFISCTST